MSFSNISGSSREGIMGESLHIEVNGTLFPVPSKGDLLSVEIRGRTIEGKTGMCLGVNPTYRHHGKRMPLVKLLFEGQVLMIPLEQVRIVQECKSKQ